MKLKIKAAIVLTPRDARMNSDIMYKAMGNNHLTPDERQYAEKMEKLHEQMRTLLDLAENAG